MLITVLFYQNGPLGFISFHILFWLRLFFDFFCACFADDSTFIGHRLSIGLEIFFGCNPTMYIVWFVLLHVAAVCIGVMPKRA